MFLPVPSYPALRVLLGLYDMAAFNHRYSLSGLRPLAARLSMRSGEVRGYLDELLRLRLVRRPEPLPMVRLTAPGVLLAGRLRDLIEDGPGSGTLAG